MTPPDTPSWSSSMLRRDLSARAHHLARTQNLLHEESTGSDSVIIFGRDEQGRHGNFHPASYENICANPQWQRRLSKPHTASRRSRARKDWRWMELDSSNSSDALLMNIFCHPGVFNGITLAPAVATLLNVDATAQPCFGINPRVPLKTIRATRRAIKRTSQEIEKTQAETSDSELWTLQPPPTPIDQNLTDRTEIDLQLDNLFVEAKLTESNFQTAAPRLIERYRDLETIFDITRLPWTPLGTVQGYQLIRDALAVYAADASFCVLCDARRRDLIETCFSIFSAVHRPTFAARLKLLTWQELAEALPTDLQQFLDEKYGINST